MKNKQRNHNNLGPKAGSLEWLLLFIVPGIGVKRWVVLGSFGVFIFACGIAFILSIGISQPLLEFVRFITFGNVLSPIWRGSVVGVVGLSLSIYAGWMLYERLTFGARYSKGNRGIIESLASHRIRSSGPHIVAIGGGTGLSALLRGLKNYTDNLTALVTPADDGGSTGRLRKLFGVPSLGDARQCLIALSDAEPLMERVFSYRFDEGEGLEGHSLGNLLLSGMIKSEGGFSNGLHAAHNLLAVRGQVLPSSDQNGVTLEAQTVSDKHLIGESSVGKAGEEITSIWLTPKEVEANLEAINAINNADAIVIGPGSLFTSILPNLLIPRITTALKEAQCPKILVCNIATQYLETDSFTAADHLTAIIKHGNFYPSHFVMNSRPIKIEPSHHQEPIMPETNFSNSDVIAVLKDIVDESRVSRHDPEKLAKALLEIVQNYK
ncbi:MAG: hypothetical protein CL777_01905 [Chloroflexi bacterium]|nr:hypothetical protein [Chloroflexota bacterium]